MDLGEADHTETLILENDGSAPATWSMSEKYIGYTPQKVNIPAFTGTLPQSDEPISASRNPNAKSAGTPGYVLNNIAAKYGITRIVGAYGASDLGEDNLYYWDNVGLPGQYKKVGAIPNGAIDLVAGDFMSGDFDTLYAISRDSTKLFAIDTHDATSQEIGTTNPPAGYHFFGLAGTTDKMYALALDDSGDYCDKVAKLYTVNLEDASLKLVGNLNDATCIADITYVPSEGMLYGIDNVTDSLYRINPANAQTTLVGELGADSNFAQGMDYDEENEIMYWAAFVGKPELRVIDFETGASESIGDFTGMSQVDSFAKAAGGTPPDRLPWLDEDSFEGELETGEEQEIELTFSVANIAQPGIYEGQLVVKDNSPYENLAVPVTLNVSRPGTLGSFNGNVYALEKCDVEPALVEKATVIFSLDGVEKYRTRTDKSGYFTYAMFPGKYDIEIELNGYVSQTFKDLELLAGQDLNIDDVELRLDAACLIIDPLSIYQEQFGNLVTEQTLTFTNTGAKEIIFEITEKNMSGPTPFSPKANEVNLILDDGSFDNSIGIGGKTDFLAINRFTPTADEFPLTLTEVSVYFEDPTVTTGNPFKVVIYQNNPGYNNPGIGSEFLYQQAATVSSVPGWTVVTLDQPVVLNGPGDVLIGAIYTHKPGEAYYPASIDQNSSQGRSWVGYWTSDDAPGTPTLPPNDDWTLTDAAGFGGNWMIRAKGGSGGDIVWLDIDIMADIIEPDGGKVDVTLTFDSTGLQWGDYFGDLQVTNAPDPRITIPVQLRVLPSSLQYQYLPIISNQ